MLRELCRAKIHRAVLNETNPDYSGSLTVPPEVMAAAGVVPWEKVQVANATSGERLETYVIPGDRPGHFALNGAAALKGQVGDIILCIFYAQFEESEATGYQPIFVIMNPDNTIQKVIRGHETDI